MRLCLFLLAGIVTVSTTYVLHAPPQTRGDIEHADERAGQHAPEPSSLRTAARPDAVIAEQRAWETLQDELDSLDYGDATQSERLQIERRATQFILFRNGLMNLSPKSAPRQEVTRLRNMTFELEKADVFDYEEGQRYRNYLDRMR